MSSIYHILDKIPAINPEDMQVEYETLAQTLVKSGRLRIDTDDTCNFARLIDPELNISLMVSKEELTDPILMPTLRSHLKSLYGSRVEGVFDKKIADIFADLKKQINKLQPVNPAVTIKLARLLVQSVHPIVIKWLLHDRVEVFITYSHNIGDMMDIPTWRSSGSNSGMQSTDGRNVAVFVSCGGDPFAETNKDHPTSGDGWPAVARLQIIAGQELGHFSDIVRDERGRQITRHSANFSGTRATDNVRAGRLNDIARCNKLLKELFAAGLDQLITYEQSLKFYKKNKIGGLRVLWQKLFVYIYKKKLLIYVHNHKLLFLKKFAFDEYMGIMIKAMIEDMAFNLAPKADVYSDPDPEVEEAIACIEALARVPQQVNKWGYLVTRGTMHDLYKIYYNQVIPSLIKNYSAMTHQPYKRDYSMPRLPLWRRIFKFSKKKEQELTPVREV